MSGTQDNPKSQCALVVSRRTGKPLPELDPQLRISVVWIYGLFDSGVCHYVGQTRTPEWRAADHFNKHGLQFMLFRHCKPSDAARLESQVLLAYQKRGQARLNKAKPHRSLAFRCGFGCAVYSSVANRTFASYSEAALFFGTSPTTINNQVHGKRNYYGLSPA